MAKYLAITGIVVEVSDVEGIHFLRAKDVSTKRRLRVQAHHHLVAVHTAGTSTVAPKRAPAPGHPGQRPRRRCR